MALLEASAITKSFAGVQALKGVSFELRCGRGACADGRERGGQIHADQDHHRRGDAGFRHAHGGWPHGGAAQQPGAGAGAGDRGGLPAAGLVPRSHGGGEYRAGAGERRAMAQGGLARAATAGARTAGARRRGHRAGAAGRARSACRSSRLVEIAKAIGAEAPNPDHGRAHGVADGPRSGEPVPRDRALRGEGAGIIYISHRLEEIVRDRRPRHGAARRPDHRHARRAGCGPRGVDPR